MILLTGFEPFGGDRSNPSIGAARRAAELLNDTGQPATAVELPCVFADAPTPRRRCATPWTRTGRIWSSALG